jgi:hypothetical protein
MWPLLIRSSGHKKSGRWYKKIGKVDNIYRILQFSRVSFNSIIGIIETEQLNVVVEIESPFVKIREIQKSLNSLLAMKGRNLRWME